MEMTTSDLTKSQQEFLAALITLSERVSVSALISLLPFSPDEILDHIGKLTRLGLLRQMDDELIELSTDFPTPLMNGLKSKNSRIQLTRMLDRLESPGPYSQAEPETLIGLYVRAGQTKKAALFAHECALKDIKCYELQTAMKRLKTVLSYLKEFLGDPECDRIFISASLCLSDVVQSLRLWFEYPVKFLNEAREAAQRLGDERHLALINLHVGRVYCFRNSLREALEAFEAGIETVNGLGDEDIMAQSAQLLGIYYFMQGMNKEAVEHFERVMSAQTYQERQLLDLGIPIFLGNSAALMGQFHRAIGVLDSNWRRARLISDHLAARFLRADLGNILLMAGKRSEALFHLQAAQEEAHANNDIFTLVQSKRGLAYYHFLEGRVQESYQLLKACLAEASKSGHPRPVYHLPWILEMLYEYHQRGYEPIPEWEFKNELNAALQGINLNLRGAALRIQAKLIGHRGDDPGKALALLQNSGADLERAEALTELAKTRAELARVKLREGNEKEAVNLALKAWEGLSIYGFESFPPEIKPLIKSQRLAFSSQNQGQEILDRYMAIMNEFVPSADRDELLSRLVTATSTFFEAERGGIFWFDADKAGKGPILQTAYYLTREETASNSFRDNMTYVFKAFKTNEPIIAQLSGTVRGAGDKRFITILCLPFEAGHLGHGVLYYDNTYFPGGFESLNKSILTRIARNVEKYIKWINEYCSQIEEKSRLALGQTTKSDMNEWEIKTQNPTMRDLLIRADRAARYDAPVLILGETGVGKELIARRIHAMSPVREMPFIAVNLSSVPETLVESELFGHEKGAFTGASRQKLGSLELANNGTFFIDEVGDIPKSTQTKILRALEEKSFYRVGGTRSINSDFRLIAATNRDIVKEVEAGNFREDLYYRLNVVPLTVPPLRDRGDDVFYLAQYFLIRYANKYNRPVPTLTSRNKAWLKAYHWPGNVRELKNVIERLIILSSGKEVEFNMLERPRRHLNPSISDFNPISDRPTMEELQRRYIDYILKETSGKIAGPGGAAELLGMKRTTLYTRMKKLGLL
ncbi:MAG: sigma 54-interacting transcriptional regulator [Deltaproteobacteria bacterium]|nr:sigma 54-interacting transcriptional regulator [Deltaproteobacteria bacterium]